MRIVKTCAVLLLLARVPAAAQHGPWIVADTESHLAEVVIRSDDTRVLVMLDTVLDASGQAGRVHGSLVRPSNAHAVSRLPKSRCIRSGCATIGKARRWTIAGDAAAPT
jgi:hypothetical protein